MPLLHRAPFSLLPRLARHAHTASRTPPPVTVGIRCEDPARVWERRAPLTPTEVAQLTADGVRVLVQPSARRVFPMADYISAGAETHPTLEPAHIVLGVKEPPLPTLLTNPLPSPHPHPGPAALVPRTHVMFSHTIKGQPYNMPLLSRFLAGGGAHAGLEPRLVDYELLTDAEGRRTTAFGWFAGVAGALESLSAMAHTHLERGVASPFLYTPRPHSSPTIDALRASLRVVGDQIRAYGTPESLGPCVIGITGSGNVTQGVLSILSELPVVDVRPEQLPALLAQEDPNLKTVYVVRATPETYLARQDGGAYDRADYYAHPEAYQSEFHTKIAPYLTLLLNGAGWAPAFPRLLTAAQLPLASRLAAIGDISCDLGGALEFVDRATTLDAPTYAVGARGVAVMSVDILPASLPRDASAAFGARVVRYVRALVDEYRGAGGDGDESGEIREALRRASVARGGKVREGFEWLDERVRAWRASEAASRGEEKAAAAAAAVPGRKKRVLVLGSGMVAGPAVDELAGAGDVEVVVASNSLAEAAQLVARHANARALEVDMADSARIDGLVGEADVVISLLPAPFHPSVAEMCIAHKKHLVTASYISPAMHALHTRALDADVLLLNEIGLDPGIDHCSAHALLARLRADGKRVVGFTSFCGGLPAPEAAEGVPLGYKFSWSPRGVLRAAGEGARFRLGGKNWEVPGERMMLEHFPDVPVSNVLKLEGLANRDSLPYVETYALGDVSKLRTMLRGTLRYPGFAALMHSFKAIGLLEATEPIVINEWTDLVRTALAQKLGTPIPAGPASLLSALSDALPAQRVSALLDALQWLALVPAMPSSAHALPHTPASAAATAAPRVPRAPLPPADLLALYLAHALRYEPHERDLVLLAHEVVVRPAHSPAGAAEADAEEEEEVHTSTLVVYGDARASAMARTVGLPVALAARRVLDGAVRVRGVRGPTAEESVWRGVLEGLEARGLGVREGVKGRGVRGMEGVLLGGLERLVGVAA